MNAKGYSAREEQRLLDALGRGLVKEFPNPGRSGCPSPDILKRIASRTMPLDEAGKWLDHLGSCSPCYSDFSRFEAAYRIRPTRTLLAIAASMLIVVCLTVWALLLKQNELLGPQTAVLDLRSRSVARGTEQNPSEPPLEIERKVSHLNIYLPMGSSEGEYGMRISGPKAKILFATKGVAKLQQGIMSLSVDVDLASASPGLYTLQIQKVDSGWTPYPLRVR